jgi:tetratricopeptide (TPR) repeat protein
MPAVAAAVRDSSRLRPWALLALFALALLVRLLALLELHDSILWQVLLGDARAYDQWALEIAGGDWLGPEVFYQAPLYPYVLGGLYTLFGRDLLLVRLLQAALGAGSAVLLAAAGARLFSSRAGLAAGILYALYVPAIWFDLLLQKTALELFLSALLVFRLSARAPWSAGRCAVLGALLALLTLSRENAAVLLLPLLAACTLAPTAARARLGAALALCGAFLLVLLPVGLRNAHLGGAFLPTAANAGVNFYIGNGLDADGLYRPLLAGRGHPDAERADATALAERLAGHELTPAQVSATWFRRAWAEIREQPGHFLRLLLRKARLLCLRTEVMDAEALEVYRDESKSLGALWPLANFGFLLPLAALGLVRARPARGAALRLALCAACLGLSIVLFFVTARFRVGLVPFLAPLAGAGLVELPALVRARSWPALGVPVLAALAANVPLALPGDPRSLTYSNLASELLRLDDVVAAERWARAAVERDPASAEAHFNLGLALRGLGRDAQAETPFREALRLEPAYAADALAELGAIRALAGDAPGAAELLERALALEPAHPQALRYRAQLRREQGF